MHFYLKDPDSRVDYAVNWAGSADGATIASSDWSVAPDEPEGIAIDAASLDLAKAKARLSGGLVGHCYSVTNRVTFSDGRREDRSIALRVEQG